MVALMSLNPSQHPSLVFPPNRLQTANSGPAEEGIVGKRSIDIDNLSLPVFRRWITGTEVIASMVGVGVLAMAVMGATG
jgi:hypothetical protein